LQPAKKASKMPAKPRRETRQAFIRVLSFKQALILEVQNERAPKPADQILGWFCESPPKLGVLPT
jgi:hypothetical protein